SSISFYSKNRLVTTLYRVCYGSAIKLHPFKERFESSKMLILRRFNRVPLFSKKNQPNWLACTSPKRERKGNF
ncbi:MAG TPA: hypothetical protein PKJ63_11265, partial [Cyclobacteriaceae bacterium]|nr:hypothetical protein [Cyclobacteriaceae bacterium]